MHIMHLSIPLCNVNASVIHACRHARIRLMTMAIQSRESLPPCIYIYIYIWRLSPHCP